MTRTSEFRRHCQKVQKNHVKHIIKNIWLKDDLSNDLKYVGKMAQTPHKLNIQNNLKKKVFKQKLKKQEIIQNTIYKDEMKEI